MKIFKITILVVALAVLGGTFTVDAKAKKRRSTVKKEKVVKKSKKKTVKAITCGLDMVQCRFQGMRMEPVSQVRVERKNGKVVLAVKGTITEEKEFVLDDGEQILKDALAIIEQEKMLDYAASYELPPELQPLDGYSWSFDAKLADGRSVDSYGHNASPGGDGLEKIRELLYKRAYKELGIDF